MKSQKRPTVCQKRPELWRILRRFSLFSFVGKSMGPACASRVALSCLSSATAASISSFEAFASFRLRTLSPCALTLSSNSATSLSATAAIFMVVVSENARRPDDAPCAIFQEAGKTRPARAPPDAAARGMRAMAGSDFAALAALRRSVGASIVGLQHDAGSAHASTRMTAARIGPRVVRGSSETQRRCFRTAPALQHDAAASPFHLL